MIPILFVCLGMAFTQVLSASAPNKCYAHYDLSAKYHLRHDLNSYPTNEINLILEKHPAMKSMFYRDDQPLSRPVSHYDPAPQIECPYNRYTLYSFFYAGKDCYVIYPDVQKVMYVQCGNDNNRDCQKCSSSGWGYGGVSKCEEDYDYRLVWAYCVSKHTVPVPRPRPQTRQVYLVSQPQIQNELHPKKSVYSEYPKNKGWGSSSKTKTHVSSVYEPATVVKALDHPYLDPWGTMFRPYMLQHRWKRSYHTTESQGKIERLKLFLPHHCGCKTFTC